MDGTFTAQPVVVVGTHRSPLPSGTINLDGKPDLVVANSTDGTLSILGGNGDGTFTLTSTVVARPIPWEFLWRLEWAK